MLISRAILDRIVAGDVDLAFRRWQRPSVKVGTRQRTPVGVIEVTAVDAVDLDGITDEEARRAGALSPADLEAWLGARSGTVFRIGLRYVGLDPRVSLRQRVIQDDDDFAELADRLARYDAASRWGPWTTAVLGVIADAPGTPAADLASRFGREKKLFKADVRKLKELGLTESLSPGYRLSPRGESYRRRLNPSG